MAATQLNSLANSEHRNLATQQLALSNCYLSFVPIGLSIHAHRGTEPVLSEVERNVCPTLQIFKERTWPGVPA